MSLMLACMFSSIRLLENPATSRLCMNFFECATLKKYLFAVLSPRESWLVFLSNMTFDSALMGISMFGFSFFSMSEITLCPSFSSSLLTSFCGFEFAIFIPQALLSLPCFWRFYYQRLLNLHLQRLRRSRTLP